MTLALTYSTFSPVSMRVECDPLGPVNKIVRLVRPDGSTIKAALHPVGVGQTVTFGKEPPTYWAGPGWRHLAGFEDEPPRDPRSPFGRYYAEVDGVRVLEVSDKEIYPAVKLSHVPIRLRAKMWLIERADRFAEKFGYHRECEWRD